VLALAARAKLVHLVLGQVQDRLHNVLTVAVRGLNKWNFHKSHFLKEVKDFWQLAIHSRAQYSDVRSENPNEEGGVVVYLTRCFYIKSMLLLSFLIKFNIKILKILFKNLDEYLFGTGTSMPMDFKIYMKKKSA
jgi:hypothetical protein